MNRRAFLQSMSYAAPTIFVPKLITVHWKLLEPEFRGLTFDGIWMDEEPRFTRDVSERIFHYTPKYAPLLLLKGGILPNGVEYPRLTLEPK